GDIGYFRILSETGVAAGIRRIEAVTGVAAETLVNGNEACLVEVMQKLKATKANAVEKLDKLVSTSKAQEKEIARLKSQLALGGSSQDVQDEPKAMRDVLVYAKVMPDVDMKIMRDHIDQLKSKHQNLIAVVGTENNGKAQLAVGISKGVTKTYQAGKLVNFVAEQVGGKGGGRPDMAQAGGDNPQNLDAAIKSVYQWVENQKVLS
ncbi:DHHA1 domain-containing protein, partial [Francisellaceae bacterium]|nr:DHHA1 domain-containing protein [Francisellaceae bacterium]